MKRFRILALLPLVLLLGACKAEVLSPSGDIALQQRDLVIISTVLMLLIIVPVMALTAWFAWHYRESNTSAKYEPDWDHSTQLELIIWAAPLLIIICLGALTWMGTHLLDPYRPLARLSPGTQVTRDMKPLQVEVVALDWKWLFIYPQYGVATVNEMAAPVDRPIDFRITASSVMNSFYVPALAGQIYAMPGMQTRLHAVINKPGSYEGFSANYSGSGFSDMHFTFLGTTDADFDKWIGQAKAAGGTLSRSEYLAFERPSEKVPVRRYASVDSGLFNLILNMCVEPGKMCMHEMAAIDAKGGLGLAGARNTLPLTYDKYARRGAVLAPAPSYVASICTKAEAEAAKMAEAEPRTLPDTAPLVGAGLPRPASPLLPAASRRPSNS